MFRSRFASGTGHRLRAADRIIDRGPKYIELPENADIHKGQELYGSYEGPAGTDGFQSELMIARRPTWTWCASATKREYLFRGHLRHSHHSRASQQDFQMTSGMVFLLRRRTGRAVDRAAWRALGMLRQRAGTSSAHIHGFTEATIRHAGSRKEGIGKAFEKRRTAHIARCPNIDPNTDGRGGHQTCGRPRKAQRPWLAPLFASYARRHLSRNAGDSIAAQVSMPRRRSRGVMAGRLPAGPADRLVEPPQHRGSIRISIGSGNLRPRAIRW